MGSGIRADVKIDSPPECPIAQASGATGMPSNTISKSTESTDAGTVTEEFILDTSGSVDGPDTADLFEPGQDLDVQEIFSYGEKRVYRFTRSRDRGCPCELIERFDCPLIDIHTRNGSLFLSFHAPEMDDLRDVIRTLRSQYPGADVQRLLRSDEERTGHNLVFIDRSTLTDRQREVLETAHQMGYFEHPKGANAGEVADTLGITTSTFTEHLAAAQRKLLSAILDT